MKNLIILFVALFAFQHVKAQHKTNSKDTLLYYLNSFGKPVTNKFIADHILMIMPGDNSSGQKLYPVVEYYPNGKPMLTSFSTSRSYDSLKFEGEYIDYFSNGKRKSIRHYEDGLPTGNITLFYPMEKFMRMKCLIKAAAACC